MSDAYRAGFLAGIEAAAKMADFHATEYFSQATDTILTDPVLSGRDVRDTKGAEACAEDGAMYAAMAHGAQNVAAAIREDVPLGKVDG